MAPKLDLLPGPDDDLDAGEAPDLIDDGTVPDELRAEWDEPEPEPAEPAEPEPVEPDLPPAPVGGKPVKGMKRPGPKVTAATRKDIEAKLGLMLTMPGNIWAARDPICGGTFLANEPQIRTAAVELIVQSPDLVAWFTGVGGGFMLWLNLIVACQPVAMIIWAHHIIHSIEMTPDGPQQARPAKQYAA